MNLVKSLTILSLAGVLLAPAPARAATGDIVSEAVVNAPADDVWKAWTTVEGMQSWMVGKADIDMRVGGTWRTSYNREADLAGDAAIHHRILAFDPGRMLAFQTVKTPRPFPFPSAILKTWTVVYLEPAGEGRTKVTVRMLGYGDDEESQKMRAFFETGNRATLDALVKRFASR
jgi:uncharacterized protein YndB with AHSA1/START domain